MSDSGIKSLDEIRSEPLTFRDGILRIDNLMPFYLKEAASAKPAEQSGAYMGVYNLLLWKDSLIRLRASPIYEKTMAKEKYLDLGLDAFNSQQKIYTNFRLIMRWNQLMVSQYSKLGIIEPERYTDVWGDKDQIVDLMHKLSRTMSLDEFHYVVQSILNEGDFIEQSLPEDADDAEDTR